MELDSHFLAPLRPFTPFRVIFYLTVGVLATGSMLTGIASLYATFAMEQPFLAELLANISSGLAMPPLALLTGWYAYQMTKMVHREKLADEATIRAYRRRLRDELWDGKYEYDPNVEIIPDFSTWDSSIMDENLEKMGMLSRDERSNVLMFFSVVDEIARRGKNKDPGEIDEDLWEMFYSIRERAIDAVDENM